MNKKLEILYEAKCGSRFGKKKNRVGHGILEDS